MQCKRVLLLCLALLTSSVAAIAAETHSFDLVNGKGVKQSSTTYTINTGKNGFKVRSKVVYVTGNQGSRTIEYAIGNDGLIDSATLTNPEDHTMVMISPSKLNDTLTINLMKGSAPAGSRTITLPVPECTVAFPDDASVWQVLMDIIAAHPRPDHIYRILVPATAKTPDRIEPFRLSSDSESAGTLDGKPIVLKHYVLTFNGGASDIYTDADGKLMQAKIASLGVTHIRTNFVLDKKK
ncbi:MAG: hypothetical protein P4L10_05910 [Acidobacteriaceae bacterium]|jgi:hypothetical protein|nr:hypothetical protein [Acidobacteriaceae bacterium]